MDGARIDGLAGWHGMIWREDGIGLQMGGVLALICEWCIGLDIPKSSSYGMKIHVYRIVSISKHKFKEMNCL